MTVDKLNKHHMDRIKTQLGDNQMLLKYAHECKFEEFSLNKMLLGYQSYSGQFHETFCWQNQALLRSVFICYKHSVDNCNT